MCCELTELGAEIGAGYSMYFQFIKYCCGILMVIMLTSGFLNLYDNLETPNPFCKDYAASNHTADEHDC